MGQVRTEKSDQVTATFLRAFTKQYKGLSQEEALKRMRRATGNSVAPSPTVESSGQKGQADSLGGQAAASRQSSIGTEKTMLTGSLTPKSKKKTLLG